MKNFLIGLVVVVLIFFGIWLFKSKNNSSSSVSNNSVTTETPTPSPTPSVTPTTPVKSATFTSILPQQGNYECNYESVTQSTRSTNVIYLSKGKMRGEFRSTNGQGIATASIMVYDGRYLYSWTEGKSTGTVSEPKSISELPALIPRDIAQSKVLGSGLYSVSWACHQWIAVPSLLAKPSYLKV